MDLSADSGTPALHNTVGGPPLELELSLSSTRCQTESGGTILLQLLEFKTHLLEAVEELHIRKDAETRFEDQISKLVLEKQELEWEKESLQRQIETVTNQHTELLNSVKKQFQAKIRNMEEEKGKHQVSAELKDKEINNLKEELRALQLLKYNLEKKSNELEQKLALQSRSKDSHLNQLGEVEKRFSVLSRQCAMVKQAHEKLEQNVDEAMGINKKLTSANEKQEATIVSLKKELEEVSNKLIKAKMTSVRHDKTQSHTDREQHIQKLHQKLNMETEMNKKLSEDNLAVRAEKQEVMRSLQLTQQLLLSQTQTVNRVELELQMQREQYQALNQEHEVMRDKSKAMEDKVAQLMESYTASKTSWDKEKEMFLDCIKTEQQDLQAVKEAYDELHRKHTEVSSLAKTQAQHIFELEMRNSSQSLSVSAQVVPLHEPISSSELPSFGSLQHLASSQTKNPDCIEDMVVTKLVATGATGGQEALNQPLNPSDLCTCPLITNNPLSSCNEKNEEGNRGMNEKKHGGKDDGGQDEKNKKEEERNTEQQRDREEVQGEDIKERGSTGEKRRTLTAQTTDRADRREDSQGSAEDAGDTRSPETETRDRAEGQGTDGAEERVKTAVHSSETPETQILSQTTTDWTTEKSNARQVVDFTDSVPRKVTEMDADSSHVNKGCGTGREGQLLHTLNSDDSQSVRHRPYPVSRVQNLRHDEVQTQNAEPRIHLPSQIHPVSEKTTEEAADFPTEPSEPRSRSRVCSSQTNAAPLAAQTETTTTQTVASNPRDITSNMKQTDEMCDIHVNEECVAVRTWVEPQPLPKSQEISEQQNGRLRSLATDNGDSSAYKKSEGQSNVDTQENYNDETAPASVEKSKNVCFDITMDTVDLESELKSVSCQQNENSVKTEEATKRETDLKVSVHPTGPRSSCDLVSPRHQFVQGSEQNASGSGGRLRHPPSTIPMFPKGKHSKVPLVITRASDLLNSSSVSGNAASSTRHQQGEWKALGETCRETTAADKGSRASLSITSFPVSTSSSTVSGLSWQATPGCSRAPTSAAGPVSESDWEPSCSQEREDQQSSIRAQIFKIEQFLNTERLCLSKRRRTDN